jgi:hypothetical protein
MFMSIRFFLIVVGVVVLSAGSGDPAAAQRFPYEAPKAPEFDGRGNYIGPEGAGSHPVFRQSATRPEAPQAPRPQRTVRPYRYEPPPPQSRPTVAAARPPVASGPPVALPQPEEAPDCTQSLSMLTAARSQQELQWNARLYLTCLLKRGWMPQQAKQEVIRVIESLRASRR